MRLCLSGCNSLAIEDESHVIFYCSVYNNLRIAWLNKIVTPPNFIDLENNEKLKIVLNSPENVKVTAQFLVDICNVRSKLMIKKSANNSINIF